jgi:hypothetical protein
MAALDNVSGVQFHGSTTHWHVGDVVDPSKAHPANHGESDPGKFYMTSSVREANMYGHLSHDSRMPNQPKPSENAVMLGMARKRSPYIPPNQVARRYTVEPLGKSEPDSHGGVQHANARQTTSPVRITSSHVMTYAEHTDPKLYLPDQRKQ